MIQRAGRPRRAGKRAVAVRSIETYRGLRVVDRRRLSRRLIEPVDARPSWPHPKALRNSPYPSRRRCSKRVAPASRHLDSSAARAWLRNICAPAACGVDGATRTAALLVNASWRTGTVPGEAGHGDARCATQAGLVDAAAAAVTRSKPSLSFMLSRGLMETKLDRRFLARVFLQRCWPERTSADGTSEHADDAR